MPQPAETAASCTHLTLCTMYSRSSSEYMVLWFLSFLMLAARPMRTYRSPWLAASLKNSMCPLCSRSKQPETRTLGRAPLPPLPAPPPPESSSFGLRRM